MRDIIDAPVVAAIDHLASSAPAVSNWWVDLVQCADALHQEYTDCIPYPNSWRPQRPYAYLPYFTPRYLPRFRHALRAAGLRLSQLVRLKNGTVRILDLGAGTGILTVACLLELEKSCAAVNSTCDVEVVLCDQDRNSLQVAHQFLEFLRKTNTWPHLRLQWNCYECNLLEDVNEGPFDLVLMGHVLCESYQCSPREDIQTDDFFASLLQPLFASIRRKLSDCGVVVIIEPLKSGGKGRETTNMNHLSTPLWIRNYARSISGLTLLAPCLGTRMECPEQANPYWKTASCSGATGVITWDQSTVAGNRLVQFAQAAKQVAVIGWPISLKPSPFCPLVLSRGEREPVPERVGMTVRRVAPPPKTMNKQPVCIVGTDRQERVEVFVMRGANAKNSVLRAVNTTRDEGSARAVLTDFDLSALYPYGWPVAK